MSNESRQAIRAVFLAAIMVISVFAAGVAFSGSAAADVTSIDAISAEDTTAGDTDQIENVTLVGVDRTGSNLSDIDVTIEGAPNLSVVGATVSSAENFDLSNVSADTRSDGGFFVEVDGNNTPNGNITIEVTLDTTNVDPGTTATYDATSGDGASASGDFQIQSDNDGSQSDGVLTVDPDGGTDAYDTIQAAVNNAESGDTVEVTSGTYDEQVVIDRDDDASDLTIRAVDGASPTISYSAEGGEPAVAIDQDDVTIEGLDIVRNNSGDLVAQAVRVAGNNVELTDNTYQLGVGANSAAVAVLTDSSGAAGGPNVTGVTISDVTISDGEIITKDASQSGVLVADDGAASFGGAGSVSVSDVTFTANADSTQVYELDTDGGVINITDTLDNNEFDRAAAASETATDASINGFSIEGIISTSIQDAVDRADSGSTVAVASGTYEESVTISTEGLTLENAESVEPTVIGQSSVAISVESPSVTISDLTIRNPEGDRGVRAIDNATNVKIARNTIEDVGTAGAFTQSRGILVSSLKNGDSASGLEVRNNTVNTIQGTGGNSDQTIGIQILEESNGGGLIENVVVDGNGVTNLLDNRSSQGINFNGNIEGDITNNNISTLNTDRPGEDLGFTQAIALNAGDNAANAPQNVRISGNSISGLDDQTPSTESFRATHIILSSVDDTDSIDIRNNVFIAAASDENYILDRASGDFDLQVALGVNTFEPSVVQVEEGSDRILVPDTGADVDVVNVDQQTGFGQVQSAVDAANSGDTIEIEAGTYNEEVTIDKPLTLIGAGNSVNGTVLNTSSSGSGNGITVDASNLTVRNLRITDYSNGIRLKNTHSNIIFENVDSVGNSNRGMEIRNSADLDDLELNNVNFSNNERGIRGATTSSIDGLTITDSSLNNNTQAIYFAQEDSGDPSGRLTDVFISDTEIIDSEQKGIYTTKLSDATFDNITIDGITSDTYGYNNGIDINLKYDDYSNITIRDSTVANVSEGDPGTPSASAAVAVKARGSTSDDSSSYTSNPATLDDVTIDNVTIEDSFNGLRVGEFGTDYSSGGGPTSVTVTDSTFQNNSGYHIRDLPSSLDLSDALNNQANDFDRVVTIKDDAGNITGDSIFGAIQPAVDEASSGDIVSVGPGTYEESVTVGVDGLTLTAVDQTEDGTIVTDDHKEIIKVAASDVTVEGFTVTSPEDPDSNYGSYAIRVLSEDGAVSDVTIQKNIVKTVRDVYRASGISASSGVSDNELDDISIENNTVKDIAATQESTDAGNSIAKGIVFNQQVISSEINGNTIVNIGGQTSSAAHGIAMDGGGPTDFVVQNNEINNLEAVGTGDDPYFNAENAIIVGGYKHLGGHAVRSNNILDGQVFRFDAGENTDLLIAKLNYWGSDRGPKATSDTNVGSRVAYDPFLTTPIENLEVDDVGDTKRFAQDIEAPADQDITAVGFPGPTDQTIGDAFGNFDGTIYEYSTENDTFEIVNDGDREISSLDAFIITQNSSTTNEDVQVVIEYADTPDDPGSPGTKTIEPGFNLVGARGLGDSYDIFNAPTDREVIYGTYGQPADRSETALLMTENADSNFIESTFGPDQDDPVVTPYGGYLVYTEEQRSITTYVQTGVTADQVITNLNQTAA